MPPAPAPDLETLLQRYERPLVRYAHSILGDLEAARDVVQETFIKYVRMHGAPVVTPAPEPPLEPGPDGTVPPHEPTFPPPFHDGRHLEGWLFTVCRHRALDHQRKHARIIPMPHPAETEIALEPSPSAQAERSDEAASLIRLLDHLPPNQREVIRLKFQNDLSYKEIAAVTRLSVTNVGFLIHTGLKKLRVLVEEHAAASAPRASLSQG